ncbi:MAG: shikimate kinase, partial [Nitrospinota bacterium]|nr:shikimate kinase [Nitrospinota bacterium]
MNIVLIGYRGTGKSTIGRVLAGKLKYPLIHMDQLIVKKTNMSIPEIVEKHGWDYFRDLESDIAADLSKMDNCI